VGSHTAVAQMECSATAGIRVGPSDGKSLDHLGTGVAIHGSTALLGAPGRVVSGTFNYVGAVYVATRNGANWSIVQQVMPPDGVHGDRYGSAIDFDGTWAVIGASGSSVNGDISLPGNQGPGSAYVYRWNGSNLVYSQKLVLSNGVQYDAFGYSVAISGTTMVVGVFGC